MQAIGSPETDLPNRQLWWAFSDQVLSSLTNFGLSVLVAQSTGIAGLGVFSLCFSAYTLGLGVSRAISSEPFAARYSGPEDQFPSVMGSYTAAAGLVGVLFGLVLVAASFLSRGDLSLALLALGATMPGLLLQDSWRFAFFARRLGSLAFANDALWAGCLVAGALILHWIDRETAGFYILVWGASGSVAGLLGMVQGKCLPTLKGVTKWLRTHSDISFRYAGEFAAEAGALQITNGGIALIAGLAALGAVRAAQLLLGPINVIWMAVRLVAIPQTASLASQGMEAVERTVRQYTLLLLGITGLWVCTVLIVPQPVWTAILGSAAPAGRHLLLPISLSMLASCIIGGATIGLRAMAAAKESLHARILSAPLLIVIACFGAISGAYGAAMGIAVGTCFGATVYWYRFKVTLRSRTRKHLVQSVPRDGDLP